MSGERPDAEGLVHALLNAANSRGLYPPAHPLVQEALDRLQGELTDRFAAGYGTVTLLVVDGELVIDGEARRTLSSYRDGLCRTLEGRGIERLSLSPGLTAEELQELMAGLCGQQPLAGSRHVVLGRVVLANGAVTDVGGGDGGVDEEHVEALTGGLQQLMDDERAGFRQLDRAVWRLMEATARSGRTFLLARRLRQLDERLYLHSVSVCLYALALARAIGIDGPALHDLATGALLHDVGLLDLPPRLLAPEQVLGPEEMTALRRHPETGAARLAGIEGVPELAVLVAYEHHAAWDAAGGYPRLPRRPNLGAQVTAVADVWDLLYNAPGGGRAHRRRRALDGLARCSGQLLNPRLVELFSERVAPRP